MVQKISLKGTLVSLIESIDLFNYLLKNHHRRTVIIASNLAECLDLDEQSKKNLLFAASLHDIGALTVEERDRLIMMDVENPREHEVIGSAMLKSFSPLTDVAAIINHHHIRYDEADTRFHDEIIPKECYILHLADRIDILINPKDPILLQTERISKEIVNHSGSLFAPWVVQAFNEESSRDSFWLDIDYKTMDMVFSDMSDDMTDIFVDENDLEELSLTFARIVDYRSQFTAAHSLGVGTVAYELAKLLNLDQDLCYKLKIAGYLHDIGKIAIPTEIIEKKGKLDEREYAQIKLHSYYTFVILNRIKGMEEICNWASRHHEKHDGSGYPYHMTEELFSIEIEIIAYADIFTSLCESRPYRKDLSKQAILTILEGFSTTKLNQKVYQLLVDHYDDLDRKRMDAQKTTLNTYKSDIENLL